MSTIRPLMIRTLCTKTRPSGSGLRSSGSKTRPSGSRDQVLISHHPVSNLILVKLAVPEDETPSEREYRVQFDALQEWNQKYWEEQNASFLQVSLCSIHWGLV